MRLNDEFQLQTCEVLQWLMFETHGPSLSRNGLIKMNDCGPLNAKARRPLNAKARRPEGSLLRVGLLFTTPEEGDRSAAILLPGHRFSRFKKKVQRSELKDDQPTAELSHLAQPDALGSRHFAR